MSQASQVIHKCGRCLAETLVIWPSCWSCFQPLGCKKCSASAVDAVFCKKCLVWGTREALLQHGPINNDPAQLRLRRGRVAPELDAYPPDWVAAYKRDEQTFQGVIEAGAPQSDRARLIPPKILDAIRRGEPLPYEGLVVQVLTQRPEQQHFTERVSDIEKEREDICSDLEQPLTCEAPQ